MPKEGNVQQENFDSFVKPKKYQRLKSFLFRWWCQGAIYFFIGFGSFGEGQLLDMIFVLCVVTGLANVLFVDWVCDEYFFEIKREKKKSYWRIPLAIGYSSIVVILVLLSYGIINPTLRYFGITFGVEPFSYGLLYAVYDYIFKTIYRCIYKKLLKSYLEERGNK